MEATFAVTFERICIVAFPSTPFLVLMRITPLAPRTPYTAVAEASFQYQKYFLPKRYQQHSHGALDTIHQDQRRGIIPGGLRTNDDHRIFRTRHTAAGRSNQARQVAR